MVRLFRVRLVPQDLLVVEVMITIAVVAAPRDLRSESIPVRNRVRLIRLHDDYCGGRATRPIAGGGSHTRVYSTSPLSVHTSGV